MPSITTNFEFQMIDSRVMIRPDARETETPGGIVLPEQSTDAPQFGEVLAVGPGRTLANGERLIMQTKKGDRVLFSPYAERVKLGTEEFMLINESDLYAIVK